MEQDLDIARKRLKFRSCHRGCKETDIILGTFAEKHLAGFTPHQLVQFEAILDENDADIFDWYTGKQAVPNDVQGEVMDMLLGHLVVEK